MTFLMIYTTYKDIEEANNIISYLLENKLIACSNILPIESSYIWNGNITNTNEVCGILKTKMENWMKVKNEISKLHSYEIPYIIRQEVSANEEYEKWVYDSCK